AIGHAYPGAQQLHQPLFTGIGSRVGGFRFRRITHGVDDEKPTLTIALEPNEATQARVDDVHDAEIASLHQPGDIGVEVDRDTVGEDAAAVERNTRQFSRLAVRPVCSNEVTSTQCSLVTALDILDGCCDTVAVLLDPDEIGSVEDPGPGFCGAPSKN